MRPEALVLVAGVAGVGVLHTIVPDHWVPITLMARQRGWSAAATARAALAAGTGHVLSTLAIGAVLWIAGAAFAVRFGGIVDAAASLALVAFGGWIALSALRGLRHGDGHGHSHGHAHYSHVPHAAAATGLSSVHGPELQRIATDHGVLELSIFEGGVPPRFRLTGTDADALRVETRRAGGEHQVFRMVDRGGFWESRDDIPEPHEFAVTVTVGHADHAHAYTTAFAEHDHGEHGHHDAHGPSQLLEEPIDDPLYAPLSGGAAVLTRHVHAHRHGNGPAHSHLHDHDAYDAHAVCDVTDMEPPLHDHRHRRTSRMMLLLILGSSPMVEGVPAFFAAAKYGIATVLTMAVVFAASTIVTYVLLCTFSAAGLQRVKLGPLERYGEVLSGAFIALVGITFGLWPAL